MPNDPVCYTRDVETIEPDEAQTQQQLIETFSSIIETTKQNHGHAFRSVHAKSHALLEGELEVLPGLYPELAQGLFDRPDRYKALIRISTNAGDPLPDSISLPRGFAIKVLGVSGDRLPGPENATQDFVLANGRSFSASDPKSFLRSLKLLAATTDKAEWGKKAISAVFRTTEKAIEALGGESVTLKTMGGYPNTHPLGERYFSQAAMRYGDFIAKLAVVPKSSNFKALEGKEIDLKGRADALREEIANVLQVEGGEWEIRVQLCQDLEKNPVEDASIPWPEDDNPYRTVAVIRVAAQPSWNPERADVLDDHTSFSPWYGLTAHQPLGGIMRARRPAYEASAQMRSSLNACPIQEPNQQVHFFKK